MQPRASNTRTAIDDEIDLRELACTLWKNKGTIIAITALTTALAAGYAYTATPVYQTTMGLLPPPVSALIEVNAQPITLSPTEASHILFWFLSIDATKSEFSTTVMPQYVGTPPPRISVSQQLSGYISISLQSSDPQHLQSLARSYLNLAVDASQKELNLRLDATRKVQLEKLEQDLSVVVEIATTALSQALGIEVKQNAADDILRAKISKAQSNSKTNLDIPWYVVDKPAATPTTPIKPRKHLIIALGVVLGGMLGACLVLIRQRFRRP